jgi:hypothetical protein
MGTRALTFVYEGERALVNMYRQYDGYPSGHGLELATFLTRGQLVNGLSGKDEVSFNGMSCLAASMIANFKETPGGFYIYSVEETECGQDYEYHVYEGQDSEGEREIRVRVTDRGCNMFGLTMSDRNEALFDGSAVEFLDYCNPEKEQFEVDLTEGQAVGRG